jgi:hypothetical protein
VKNPHHYPLFIFSCIFLCLPATTFKISDFINLVIQPYAQPKEPALQWAGKALCSAVFLMNKSRCLLLSIMLLSALIRPFAVLFPRLPSFCIIHFCHFCLPGAIGTLFTAWIHLFCCWLSFYIKLCCLFLFIILLLFPFKKRLLRHISFTYNVTWLSLPAHFKLLSTLWLYSIIDCCCTWEEMYSEEVL